MTNNPYESPDSDVNKSEKHRARPIRAIVFGVIIDIGGTIVGVVILTIVYVAILASSGATQDEVDRVLSTAKPTTFFGFVTAMWGVFMSFIAGFYCVRISRAIDWRYPATLALLVFIIGIAMAGGTMDSFILYLWSFFSVGATFYGAARAMRTQV